MISLVQMGDTSYYKIGYTFDSVDKRVLSLQGGNPLRLRCIVVWEGNQRHEKILHTKLRHFRASGPSREWYDFPPYAVKQLMSDRAIWKIHTVDANILPLLPHAVIVIPWRLKAFYVSMIGLLVFFYS